LLIQDLQYLQSKEFQLLQYYSPTPQSALRSAPLEEAAEATTASSLITMLPNLGPA